MSEFILETEFEAKGDQPKAIERLVENLTAGQQHNVLLGVTGSGKTFTMANVIAQLHRPALIVAPNKTLAAQLYHEFKQLFPSNAVEYFVSYYDYYQPEAYIPASDTYIEKDSAINEMIDKLRHSATRSVLTRRDVIVVASVSCIYGLGSPDHYLAMRLEAYVNERVDRDDMIKTLVAMQYERNDLDFHRGTFRVRGDRIEIFPAYEDSNAIRIDFFGDEIDAIAEVDALRGNVSRTLSNVAIFPASHYVVEAETRKRAFETIKAELKQRLEILRQNQKYLEHQRLEERTNFDLEMINELGYCSGIENYSRHLTSREPGEPPPTLLDYFPKDFLVFIDESHITVPQLGGMYKGDRSRKTTLVEYGFRLPSAMDNRPLRFEEIQTRMHQLVYVSATPADYELQLGARNVAEQIVRPTGLVDPEIEIRKATSQVDDLYAEIRKAIDKEQRVLVTTLTKRMAEDLTDYYSELGLNVRYLHSDIKTLERLEIVRDLRLGEFDVLIGINLLREGLDIPEVALIAIMDADKEGFLRSTRSLIQTCGRAARNVDGRVIMYADEITRSMQAALDEMQRRREIQLNYNIEYDITPQSVKRAIEDNLFGDAQGSVSLNSLLPRLDEETQIININSEKDLEKLLKELETEMKQAAKEMEYERAAVLRDQIAEIKRNIIFDFK